MKKDMKTYYNNERKEENTALPFASFKNGDAIQKLFTRLPDDQALGERELHTLEDMRWNDNHQRHIKYRSRDIIKSMRWQMRQSAYTEHLVFAPQRCFNSHTPQNTSITK